MMSADRWSVCPECVKRAKGLRDAFRDKYYGKMDPISFTKIFAEIERAVEHVEYERDDEFEVDEEVMELARKEDISVEWNRTEFDEYQILQSGQRSPSLREDYELGIDEEGYFSINYGAGCDCGFDKSFRYDERKEKKELE
jgi:hypothetical protein